MKRQRDDTAIVILAGGLATRFPGKLERLFDGEPMLLRVYHNARATGMPVYVAGNARFAPAIADRLRVPFLVDRWPGGGPLRALFSACESIGHARVFALAADEPLADAALLQRIAGAWLPGDDAVVPRHHHRIEPLVALYVREAVLRGTGELPANGRHSMHALVDRIQTRFVDVSDSYFANVNTPDDLRRATGAVG
jgi:molybdopterin-guanine dinucleotide biosynthesis protein A